MSLTSAGAVQTSRSPVGSGRPVVLLRRSGAASAAGRSAAGSGAAGGGGIVPAGSAAIVPSTVHGNGPGPLMIWACTVGVSASAIR